MGYMKEKSLTCAALRTAWKSAAMRRGSSCLR